MKKVRWHSDERRVPVFCIEIKSWPVIHQCAMVAPDMIKISESSVASTASRVVKEVFMQLAAAEWPGLQQLNLTKSAASHRWLHEWLTSEPHEFSLREAGKCGWVTLGCPWCWTSAGLKLSAVIGAELVVRFHSVLSVVLEQCRVSAQRCPWCWNSAALALCAVRGAERAS